MKSEKLILEIAEFIGSSPRNISRLTISIVCSSSCYYCQPSNSPTKLSSLSDAPLLELFKSIAVNDVLTGVEVSANILFFYSCAEKTLELLLENNFTLKTFWFSQPTGEEEFSFAPFVNRNKYLRKQRRFKAVKPVLEYQ